MENHLKNLLIVDIETVAQSADFSGIPESLQEHWGYKASFLRNEEDLPVEELFSNRAGIYAEFGKVIVAGFGIFHELDGELAIRVKSFAADDEKSLLADIKEFLEKKFDPETLKLCAHNGKEFDFPYLSRRMLVNGLKLPYVLDNSGKR